MHTNAESERVCDGGDCDGNGGVFERLSEPLLGAELEAGVTPGRHQDEHVINADTCERNQDEHVINANTYENTRMNMTSLPLLLKNWLDILHKSSVPIQTREEAGMTIS